METYENRFEARQEPDSKLWYIYDRNVKGVWHHHMAKHIRNEGDAKRIAAGLNNGSILP